MLRSGEGQNPGLTADFHISIALKLAVWAMWLCKQSEQLWFVCFLSACFFFFSTSHFPFFQLSYSSTRVGKRHPASASNRRKIPLSGWLCVFLFFLSALSKLIKTNKKKQPTQPSYGNNGENSAKSVYTKLSMDPFNGGREKKKN